MMLRLHAAAALLALAPSCTLLPLGGRPTSAPGGAPSSMGEGLFDYRTVFHCHSLLSHDSDGTIEEIVAAAAKHGINAVLLTDHHAPGNVTASRRGLVDGVLLVPGIEKRIRRGGSLLTVGDREELDDGVRRRDLPAWLGDRGAFVVAGHLEKIPEDLDLSPFRGIEVYNLHAEFQGASVPGLLLKGLFLTPDAFFEAAITTPDANLGRWDRELARGHRLVPVAAQDAHQNVRVLGPLGGTVGTYEELFRLFSTRVLAPELTEAAIVAALRRGRVYVVFDYLGDGAGFTFRYVPPAGPPIIVGGEAPWRPGGRIEIRAPADARLRLLRDGVVLTEGTGTALDAPAPGPGVYRAEVYRGERLWILSSPVWITSP